MRKLLTVFALACLTFNVLTASAADSDIKKAIEKKLGGPVEKVNPTPIAGLWEVIANGEVIYTDKEAKYILVSGFMVERTTGRNMTAENLNKSLPQGVDVFKSLPLELAVKQVRGSGKNVLVTFEDPRCGYCKKLARELLAVKDITVYTFLYPVLGPESKELSKAIWCSSDKSKAWIDWMTEGKSPAQPAASCDVAGLDKSFQLGRKLRINGTPALFFANGERNGGYLPGAEVEKRLSGS